jgi:hypothetical protein
LADRDLIVAVSFGEDELLMSGGTTRSSLVIGLIFVTGLAAILLLIFEI